MTSAARTRLAALTVPGGSSPSRAMTTHRVLADFPAFGALSPDGQRLSYNDWGTGDFTLIDEEYPEVLNAEGEPIETGVVGPVPAPAGG